ncbi:hypothetical protein ARTHROSP310_06880 [Arthrobacter sp. AD-310]
MIVGGGDGLHRFVGTVEFKSVLGGQEVVQRTRQRVVEQAGEPGGGEHGQVQGPRHVVHEAQPLDAQYSVPAIEAKVPPLIRLGQAHLRAQDLCGDGAPLVQHHLRDTLNGVQVPLDPPVIEEHAP